MPLIIDQPKLVPWPKRLGWGTATFLFWIIWIYLWMPFITLAAWFFGVSKAHTQFWLIQELVELQRLVVIYAAVIIALGSTLLIWALIDFLRFRNVHRRIAPTAARQEELADYIGVPEQEIAALHNARSIVAHHDDHGVLIGADIKSL